MPEPRIADLHARSAPAGRGIRICRVKTVVRIQKYTTVTNMKNNFIIKLWRGARVVERDGLENRCTFTRTEGSNPSLSAIFH